jgi:hypothetical protein
MSAKYVYFQELDYGSLGKEDDDIFPVKTSIREALVKDGKEEGRHYDRNYKALYTSTAGLSAFFGYLFYLSL